MRDRKLNKFILISSVFSIVLGVLLLAVGAGVSVYGFVKPEELLKIDEVFFFVNQLGIEDLQKFIFGGLLKFEYLFLCLGILVASISLLLVIFAIIQLRTVKKCKVVNRRLLIILFNLIPLAIVACATVYLVLEFDLILDVVKYVLYGIIGAFGFISLLNLLGVVSSRGEQFMSNDNSKYSFDNNSIKNARVEVNNNIRNSQARPVPSNQVNVQQSIQRQRPQQSQVVQRPANNMQYNMQNSQTRQPVRPAQSQAVRVSQGQPIRPMMNSQARPQGVRPNMQQPSRPMPPRPQINTRAQNTARPVTSMNSSIQTRPTTNMVQRPTNPTAIRPQNPNAVKYCAKCGARLNNGETFCRLCGNKVV